MDICREGSVEVLSSCLPAFSSQSGCLGGREGRWVWRLRRRKREARLRDAVGRAWQELTSRYMAFAKWCICKLAMHMPVFSIKNSICRNDGVFEK